MPLKHVPGPRIISRTENLRPTVNEQQLLLAAIIKVAIVRASFARPYVGKTRILYLKVFDSTVVNGTNPTILTPTQRVLKTAFRTDVHFSSLQAVVFEPSQLGNATFHFRSRQLAFWTQQVSTWFIGSRIDSARIRPVGTAYFSRSPHRLSLHEP